MCQDINKVIHYFIPQHKSFLTWLTAVRAANRCKMHNEHISIDVGVQCNAGLLWIMIYYPSGPFSARPTLPADPQPSQMSPPTLQKPPGCRREIDSINPTPLASHHHFSADLHPNDPHLSPAATLHSRRQGHTVNLSVVNSKAKPRVKMRWFSARCQIPTSDSNIASFYSFTIEIVFVFSYFWFITC